MHVSFTHCCIGLNNLILCLAYAENLCQGNSSGYIYNATVPLCYKIDTQPRVKTAAESFCGEFGGRLLRINTERKQRFVEDLDLKETGKSFQGVPNYTMT